MGSSSPPELPPPFQRAPRAVPSAHPCAPGERCHRLSLQRGDGAVQLARGNPCSLLHVGALERTDPFPLTFILLRCLDGCEPSETFSRVALVCQHFPGVLGMPRRMPRCGGCGGASRAHALQERLPGQACSGTALDTLPWGRLRGRGLRTAGHVRRGAPG